ncbi:MAG: hypothetical protein KBS96_01825 [Lachnospiraceae bacterium]|nr:hypothetical protein [Candidatus Colinaster scatohippi]
MKRRIGIPALIMIIVLMSFLAGCKKEEVYDPDKFLIGSEGGNTEYQDVPTEVRSFSYTYYSDMMPLGYTFRRGDDGATLEGEMLGEKRGPVPIEEAYLAKLDKWVDDYNVRSWDGFSMTDSSVLDGGGFSLEVVLGTGESIYASGSNAYPDNYNEAIDALTTIMDSAVADTGLLNEAEDDGHKFVGELTLTDEMFDYYAKEEWQKAYRDILKNKYIKEGNPQFDECLSQFYGLYDINKDQIPEIIIKSGTCEADYITEVYCMDGDKAVKAGELTGGHTAYYTNPDSNGIIEYNAHMAYAAVINVELDGSKLSDNREIVFEDDLYERMQLDSDADYTPVGDIIVGTEPIYMYPLTFSYGLLEYIEPMQADYDMQMTDALFESGVRDIIGTKTCFYGVYASVYYNADAGFCNEEMGMLELYERGGLFPDSDGSTIHKETIFADFNDDGKEEALAIFYEDEEYCQAVVYYVYQNGKIYGYISRPYYMAQLEVENGHIYVNETGAPSSELIFEYYLNQGTIVERQINKMVIGELAKESLVKFRQDAKDQKGELAVAYLGNAGKYADKMLMTLLDEASDEYSDLAFVSSADRLTCVKQPGEEVYMLVPVHENYTIAVYEQLWGEDTPDGMPKRGKLLYQAEPGEIVLVRGNQSDIVSNIEVSLEMFGKEMIYHPELSLENGRLNTSQGIVDFTIYEDAE